MITIREAQESDVPQIVHFVTRILYETGAQKAPLFDEVFWRWEYRTPGREALVVLAVDENQIVGVFHLTPAPCLLMTSSAQWCCCKTLVLTQDIGGMAFL